MKKLLIEDCTDCPNYGHLSNGTPSCTRMRRTLPYKMAKTVTFRSIPIYTYEIPDWCPLPEELQ